MVAAAPHTMNVVALGGFLGEPPHAVYKLIPMFVMRRCEMVIYERITNSKMYSVCFARGHVHVFESLNHLIHNSA